MKFHLRVYDNFHYANESEAYNVGMWRTYEEAVEEARKIVYKWLYDNCHKNSTVDKLIESYCFYGDDPAILYEDYKASALPPSAERFSGRDYAGNQIEGKFGQGKNGYNLNKIRARASRTSESWIACILFVMNLIKFSKDFLFSFFSWLVQLTFSNRNVDHDKKIIRLNYVAE